MPGAKQRDADESFPGDLVTQLFEVEFLGSTIAEEHGSLVSVSTGLAGTIVRDFGTDEQQAEWLQRLASDGLGA